MMGLFHRLLHDLKKSEANFNTQAQLGILILHIFTTSSEIAMKHLACCTVLGNPAAIVGKVDF